MTARGACPIVSHRLEALIQRQVGWQVDNLQVLLDKDRLILEGHVRCAFARRLAEDEAARLTGLPIENHMEVN